MLFDKPICSQMLPLHSAPKRALSDANLACYKQVPETPSLLQL